MKEERYVIEVGNVIPGKAEYVGVFCDLGDVKTRFLFTLRKCLTTLSSRYRASFKKLETRLSKSHDDCGRWQN